MNNNPANGEFLLYQTEDAQSRLEVRLIDGTLWLTQKQLSELYQVKVGTINGHLRIIYEDGELDVNRTIRKSRIVALEGKGGAIRKADVGIAKNYLNEDEMATLNRIVNAYIEIAELQAQAGKAMTRFGTGLGSQFAGDYIK